jgi:tripartite-type tricarboxylate transporter receptor subunit TctC
MAGVKLLHVPYRGMGPALIDLTAGRIQLAFVGLAPIKSSLETGALKALAVAQPSRLAAAPNIPSADETGLPGYEFVTWFGVVTTGGTPAAIVDKLNSAIAAILQKPAVRQRLIDFGMEPLSESPGAFAARIQMDYEKYGAVIKAAQIKID